MSDPVPTTPDVTADIAEVGALIASSKLRGIVYAALGIAGVALTASNGIYAYLWAAHAIAAFPIWLGAVGVAFPIVSSAVHGIAKANTK